MNRLFAIIGLILLAVALVFLSQGIKKAAPSEHDEQDQAAQTQKKADTTPVIDPNIVPASEEMIGDPAKAKHHITLGWVYDENNLKKPEVLISPMQTLREFVEQHGNLASAEIVNLDVPMEYRSPAARKVTDLGIHVDGSYPYGDNLSTFVIPRDQLEQMLTVAIQQK